MLDSDSTKSLSLQHHDETGRDVRPGKAHGLSLGTRGSKFVVASTDVWNSSCPLNDESLEHLVMNTLNPRQQFCR